MVEKRSFQENHGVHSQRWHPDLRRHAPNYLNNPFIAPHKRAYLGTLHDIHLLVGHDKAVIIPGVGGPQEPFFLAQEYGKQVVSLDRNRGVIEKHQRDNLRRGQQDEVLVLGDASCLPFAKRSAQLVSFSSVMHEVISREIIDRSTCAGLTAFRKDDAVKRQIRELKRVIAPGGILAIQDILPQPFGRGRLRLETAIADGFFRAFLKHHSSKHFKYDDKYTLGSNGRKIEVIGSYTDLSEIWWHFRRWWVDQIRRNAPKKLVDSFASKVLGENPTKKQATDLRLSRNHQFMNSFDRYLEQSAKDRFNAKKPLLGFREWVEVYNISSGIGEVGDYMTSLFSDENAQQEWFVLAYVIEDDRDNALLNRHFSLFNESGTNHFTIEPKRMIIFALRPTEDREKDGAKLEKILNAADKNVGQDR